MVTQLLFICLYNTDAIIIALIIVNIKLLFHVESLMFDACSDKALLKFLCKCCKLFLLSSLRIYFTTGKKNRHFGKWVLSQKSFPETKISPIMRCGCFLSPKQILLSSSNVMTWMAMENEQKS